MRAAATRRRGRRRRQEISAVRRFGRRWTRQDLVVSGRGLGGAGSARVSIATIEAARWVTRENFNSRVTSRDHDPFSGYEGSGVTDRAMRVCFRCRGGGLLPSSLCLERIGWGGSGVRIRGGLVRGPWGHSWGSGPRTLGETLGGERHLEGGRQDTQGTDPLPRGRGETGRGCSGRGWHRLVRRIAPTTTPLSVLFILPRIFMTCTFYCLLPYPGVCSCCGIWWDSRT
ncbi:hypothetical protein QBC39DRAFT_87107 [Podospora conica]|nr:hypothetical protein QBC39DRAFT_87107 [Schizothecium conicum]